MSAFHASLCEIFIAHFHCWKQLNAYCFPYIQIMFFERQDISETRSTCIKCQYRAIMDYDDPSNAPTRLDPTLQDTSQDDPVSSANDVPDTKPALDPALATDRPSDLSNSSSSWEVPGTFAERIADSPDPSNGLSNDTKNDPGPIVESVPPISSHRRTSSFEYPLPSSSTLPQPFTDQNETAPDLTTSQISSRYPPCYRPLESPDPNFAESFDPSLVEDAGRQSSRSIGRKRRTHNKRRMKLKVIQTTDADSSLPGLFGRPSGSAVQPSSGATGSPSSEPSGSVDRLLFDDDDSEGGLSQSEDVESTAAESDGGSTAPSVNPPSDHFFFFPSSSRTRRADRSSSYGGGFASTQISSPPGNDSIEPRSSSCYGFHGSSSFIPDGQHNNDQSSSSSAGRHPSFLRCDPRWPERDESSGRYGSSQRSSSPFLPRTSPLIAPEVVQLPPPILSASHSRALYANTEHDGSRRRRRRLTDRSENAQMIDFELDDSTHHSEFGRRGSTGSTGPTDPTFGEDGFRTFSNDQCLCPKRVPRSSSIDLSEEFCDHGKSSSVDFDSETHRIDSRIHHIPLDPEVVSQPVGDCGMKSDGASDVYQEMGSEMGQSENGRRIVLDGTEDVLNGGEVFFDMGLLKKGSENGQRRRKDSVEDEFYSTEEKEESKNMIGPIVKSEEVKLGGVREANYEDERIDQTRECDGQMESKAEGSDDNEMIHLMEGQPKENSETKEEAVLDENMRRSSSDRLEMTDAGEDNSENVMRNLASGIFTAGMLEFHFFFVIRVL